MNALPRRRIPWILLPVLGAMAAISCIFSPLAWSPDSGRLAYVATSTETGQLSDPHELQILDPGTGQRQTVLRSTGFLGPPAYSRDGGRIAMLETNLLLRLDEENAAASQPASHPATVPATAPAESPEVQRRWLYLRLVTTSDWTSRRIPIALFAEDADSNDVADALLLTPPAFSPDGKQFYCHARAEKVEGGATWCVLAVTLETGELRRVATGASFPLLSPDGSLLAAWVAPQAAATLPASAPAIAGSAAERWAQLALLPSAGGEPRRVDVFRREGEAPLAGWAAGNRGLVVWGRRAGAVSDQLLLVRPGEAIAALPWRADRPTAPPAAMPDGRILLAQRTDLAAAPGEPATSPANEGPPRWRVDLLAMSLPSGRAELFATGPAGVHRGCVAVSPDGKWVALRESLSGGDASDLQRSEIRLLDGKGRDVRTIQIHPMELSTP